VEDNGIGFEEKYLDRIFGVFQRLHGRGQYDGTGVGLAICQKIAERHGGRITAKSSPGQGATFIVTLPVKQPRRREVNDA
ncbi:MAG: ATPase, partial [Desulfobacterales bacterium]